MQKASWQFYDAGKVDDMGTIHVKWDVGGNFGIVYREDVYRIVDSE